MENVKYRDYGFGNSQLLAVLPVAPSESTQRF